MGLLEGKVALITGAARGMGTAHAVRLAEEGADIILFDVPRPVDSVEYELPTADDLERAAEAVRALGRTALVVSGDVRSQDDLDHAVAHGVAELGRIDILVANAGIWTLAPLWKMTEQMWRDTVDINLTGVWQSVKAVAPHMIQRERGSIVMISSDNGLEGATNYAHYAAAKHGVIGLMRSTALELGPHGIRSNAVCPGFVDTPIHEWQGALDMMAGRPGGTANDRLRTARHSGILKGVGALPPRSVSNAVLWLASNEAEHVTAVAIPVDAGHLAVTGYNVAGT